MPRARKGRKTGEPRDKASKAVVALRVEEVLRIRLKGAKFWDVREYVSEKQGEPDNPWTLTPRQKPLSDGMLWKYIGKADAALEADQLPSRKRLLKHHIAKRQFLYGEAVVQGDLRTALAVLSDEAKLRDLYPAARVKADVKVSVPFTFAEVAASDAAATGRDGDEG